MIVVSLVTLSSCRDNDYLTIETLMMTMRPPTVPSTNTSDLMVNSPRSSCGSQNRIFGSASSAELPSIIHPSPCNLIGLSSADSLYE